MHGDVLPEGGFQFFHAAERATSNALVGELSKPAFNQIDPGTVSGREMDVKAWALSEPLPNHRSFVSAVVVHNDMNLQLGGHLSLNHIQEFPELTRPVPVMLSPLTAQAQEGDETAVVNTS